MKNLFKVLGIIAMVAVMASVSGCAMMSSVGGTADPHGLINGNGSSNLATAGAEEIGNYMVILGLIDSGYDGYIAAVNAAIASGKQVSSVTKWYYFITITTAYAK